MKTEEINIPTSIRSCSPEQMAKWLLLAESVDASKGDLSRSLDFLCQVVSIFAELPMSKIRKFHIDDVTKAAKQLLEMLAEYSPQDPSDVITIEGQEYCFEKDSTAWSTGQIIDMKLIEDVASTPWEALAIMYVEKGMEYCQEDDRGKVLNPNKKREEIFKRSFPGDEFVHFFYFFLTDCEKRKLAISAIQILRTMEEREKIEKSLSEIQSGSPGQSSSSGWRKRWVKMLTRLRLNPM